MTIHEAAKLKGRYWKTRSGSRVFFVEAVDPAGGAGKHVIEIFCVQADALGFAGSS